MVTLIVSLAGIVPVPLSEPPSWMLPQPAAPLALDRSSAIAYTHSMMASTRDATGTVSDSTPGLKVSVPLVLV